MKIQDLKNQKVLVTGASGFIASHLVKTLHELGAKLFVVTKYNSVIDNIRLAKLWDQVTPIEADLRNSDSLSQIKDIKPDYIFHLAAYNHVGDSFLHVNESLTSNMIGTANLMEAYSGYKKFVYIATSEVYGHQLKVPFQEDMTPFPTSPYALGKYAGELFAQMQYHVKNLPIVMIRPFNAFGPYQSPRAIIAEMIIKCLQGETIRSTEGIQTRSFNYVTNLIDGMLKAVETDGAVGKVLNIGSDEEITVKDLILKIHTLTESKSKLEIGSIPYRPTEIWRMCADSTKAHSLFGWEPKVSFDEGLSRTIKWYKKYLNVYKNPESPLLEL